MSKIKDVFGTMVFDRKTMKERLPEKVFSKLMDHMESGEEITSEMADVIAEAAGTWAQELGATHYTHWFQPMTGVTAEKHDSFLDFSGKALIKGEPDASSFPSGGMRATFEARGYTAWDPSSYMFIKENTLCIPTVFCSYSGEALDKKTPLLRSEQALDRQAKRVLNAIGEDTGKVFSNIGAEQEYFLISKDLYAKREDLIFTGRTLMGMQPPKTQEMDDHYFGVLKTKVKSYMDDLDSELWKLGIKAHTEHNEVAPSQHELAPIFTIANIAADQNQITMELMKKTAERHGLRCLLHEKPFDGINGSGKHLNWSMTTGEGENLLKPGKDPISNKRFLLFFMAVIKAVDDYQDLMRISVASAGNDHRLGGSEAPPAIISIFIGDELYSMLESLENGTVLESGKKNKIDMGVSVLPDFMRDTTDRNRTSPFAFTECRFEFRMVGSRAAISCPSYMLNTITADTLSKFADELEKGMSPEEVVSRAFTKHKRIIFNGDNYTDEWVKEAGKRGLMNIKTTPQALSHFDDPKNVKLFTAQDIFSEVELTARKDILMEEYDKTVNIEAMTLSKMLKKQIIPVAMAYQKNLAESIDVKRKVSPDISCQIEYDHLIAASIYSEKLGKNVDRIAKAEDSQEKLEIMQDARRTADALEEIIPNDMWPMPDYAKLLFS